MQSYEHIQAHVHAAIGTDTNTPTSSHTGRECEGREGRGGKGGQIGGEEMERGVLGSWRGERGDNWDGR